MIKIKHTPPISQAIPLSPDDLIRVEIISSTVPAELTLEGSCYNSQGDIVPFIETLNVTVALTPTAFNIRLGYEFLFSAVLHTRTSGIPDGSCYCRMSLCKSESSAAFPFRKLLAQGYVATTASIGYGSLAILGAPTDHFFSEHIEITPPGAGLAAEFICPDFTRLKIQVVHGTFTTNAVVSNRALSLDFTMPPAADFRFIIINSVSASQTILFSFGVNLSEASWTSLSTQNQSIPEINLFPGSSLKITAFNLNAGDVLTDLGLLVLRQTIPFN